ncbi:MAG: hypothetical protein V1739_04945 [Candidatus Omnitrophota bacterium]
MQRKYSMVFVFILLSVIFVNGVTAATKKQQEETPYVANFNYTSDSQSATSSTGVTIATIGIPTYITNSKELWFNTPQFENFQKALKEDLPKLLTAKGCVVKGSYDSYEMIPYPDKKKIDLYLTPTVALFITSKGPSEILPKWVVGMVKIKGKIMLELREVVTKELMWSKTVEFEEFKFPVYSIKWAEGTNVHKINDVTEKAVSVNDVTVMNEVAKGIEKQYPAIMASFFKLIDPEEMIMIKKECQELKSKKTN